jgi:hypothetical protein
MSRRAPSLSELDASCDVCGHLRRNPPFAENVIARAAFPDFADRATRGCIICSLICNKAYILSTNWSSFAQAEVVISVHPSRHYSQGLEVRGYELLKPCPPDRADSLGNSRSIFHAALYSPLSRILKDHHTWN